MASPDLESRFLANGLRQKAEQAGIGNAQIAFSRLRPRGKSFDGQSVNAKEIISSTLIAWLLETASAIVASSKL